MIEIYLARHGQNEDNANGILNGHRDEPLTEIGLKQAQNLAREIKRAGFIFKGVYTSPLSRAYATAEAVTDALGMQKPFVLQDLIERDFGIMTGKFAKDIEELCAPDIIKANPITYFLSPEGAETFPQLLERAKRVIQYLESLRHAPGEAVLLVGHGDMGKMIYAAYYDLDWKEVLTKFHFGNSELLLLARDWKPDLAHVIQFEQYNQ